jgi:hypothetical protein
MSEPQEEVQRVDAGSLRLSGALGSGGQGTVYAVADRLVDEKFPAVYKEFSVAANGRALLEMVRFRHRLAPAEARRLDDIAAWPATVVERDGRLAGFLMRRAPDPFLIGLGMPRGPTQHLAQVQLLLNDKAYRTARGLAIDDQFRLELLHDTASAIEFLHAHGVVVGDLSPSNLLFSRSRRPRCFFLDCDAMRRRGASVLRQAETVDWETPNPGEQIATWATDSYKFALLCIRLFAGDQSSRDPEVLDRAGPVVQILATRGLSADPQRRPVLAEWREALSGAAPPQRRLATVSRPARGIGTVLGVIVSFAAILLFLLVRLLGCGDTGQAPVATPAAEQADGIARVLTDDGGPRALAAAAARNVAACTDVHTAVADLSAGATARSEALQRVRALPTDALTGGNELKAQLVEALAHAQRADQAYANWAAAVDRTGCRSAAMNDPERRTGDAESKLAAAAGKRFAALWNPLAAEYGHPIVSDQDI